MMMDELLIERAKNGDAAAYEELILPYRKYIRSIAWHYMKNLEDMQDCEIEALTRTWTGLSLYRHEGSFKAFVGKVTARVCLNALKKKKQQGADVTDSLDEKMDPDRHEIPFSPEDKKINVEREVIQKNDVDELWQNIRKLPPDQQDALVLTQIQQVSYKEVARMEGVPEGTVKSRVNRAIKQLAQMMNPPDPPENKGKMNRSMPYNRNMRT